MYGGKKASDLQGEITISNDGTISGPVYFIEGGLAESGPLAGDGYFLALHWSDPDANATSLKVGLKPSASGMPLQECIDDTDRNGVFKISDPETQTFMAVTSNATKKTTQSWKLTGLTFTNAPEDTLGA